jgi:hypothetical protein
MRPFRHAFAIFAIAVAARLAFIGVHGVITAPDSSDYRVLSRNILRFHAFGTSAAAPVQPSVVRPPVYPLLLTLFGHSSIAAVIVQSVLDALVCVMLFLIASRVARAPFAAAVSFLYAIHPGAIVASATILSEATFTVLLCTAVLLTLIAAERVSVPFAICAGATFGLATLCRSIGVIYLIAAATVLIVRRFPRVALAVLLGASVSIAPWIIRCSRVAGRFVFIQAPSAVPWYLPTLWWLDQNDEPAIWRYFLGADPYGARLKVARTPGEVLSADDFGRQQAFANVRQSPAGYLRSRARTFPHLFLNTFDGVTGINRSIGDVVRAREFPALAIKLGLMLLFTALPMAAAGFGLGASQRTLTGSLTAAMWIVTMAVHLAMFIEYRYWLPVLPFQLVTAALGFDRIGRILNR